MRRRNKKGTGLLFSVEQLHTFELKRALFTAASAVVFLCALLIPSYPIINNALYCLSFLLSGCMVAADLFRNIVRKHAPFCPELLILISGAVCFFAAGFGDAACVMLFYSLSVVIQSVALACEQSSAWSPVGMVADRARVVTEEGIFNEKSSKVRDGDMCIVDSGSIVPADGIISDGMTEMEISVFGFEPYSTTVAEGTYVPSGSVNKGESVTVTATRDYADSFAQKVLSSFSESVNSDTGEEIRISAFFNYFAVAVCAITAVLCLIVPIFKGEWTQKANIGASMLVLCCPFCLKGLLTVSTFKAIEKIFSQGSVIREAAMLDKLATISEVVCNKTGTVTESSYTVTDIQTQGINEKNFLILVSKIECCSSHPIAEAVRDYCGTEKIDAPESYSFSEIEGRGIAADIGGNSFLFGNAAFLTEYGISCMIPDKSGLAVHLAVNGNYCGYMLFENKTRQSSYDAVETLRAMGVAKMTMLSCDLRSIARPVAAALNFDSIKSELTAEDKVNSVRYIVENKNRNTCVAYVGNGTDEIIAGAEADIYISTGMLGRDYVLENADITVMTSGMSTLPVIIATAKQARKVSRINLLAGIIIRVLLLLVAIKGVVGPAAVSVILLLASVFAAFNTIVLFGKYK